jgi:hypothetical protein
MGMRGGKWEVSFAFQRKTTEIICNTLTKNAFLTFFPEIPIWSTHNSVHLAEEC